MNGKAHPEPWGGEKRASVLPTFFLVGSGGISCCFITDGASFMAISEQMLFALVRVKAELSTHFGKEVSAFFADADDKGSFGSAPPRRYWL